MGVARKAAGVKSGILSAAHDEAAPQRGVLAEEIGLTRTREPIKIGP